MVRRLRLIACCAPLLLVGCDMLGIESAQQIAARKESESKAIGAGCRHAGRSVEACFALNKRADKAAVFAGWKEMSEYMAENKLETAAPAAASAPATGEASKDGANVDDEAAVKSGAKEAATDDAQLAAKDRK